MAETDGSLALQERQRRVITIPAAEQPEDVKFRVAAYCRVSSASDDQLNSFAAQNRYYTDLIAGKENWQLVDIYADEGITGTSAEKRDDLQRMLADCRRGLIDRILVKSISRFARNTKECLETIRELKLIGVSVSFEKENIDTATMSGEMMTATFAAMAQAESESISGNMRWSYQKSMQNGTFLPGSMPFGYKIKDKKIHIVESEAKTIWLIFADYLAGLNFIEIANKLNNMGIPKRTSGRWFSSTIKYILTNEKYIGDSLWQKKYATNNFPHHVVRNQGERPMYYAEGTHPAIISKEIFDVAQALIKSRRQEGRCKRIKAVLSQTIICNNCKSNFQKKIVRGKTYWICVKHKNDGSCKMPMIQEREIYEAFLKLYYKLKHYGTPIFEEMLSSLQTIRSHRMLWSEDVISLNKQISELLSQNQLLAELKQQGLVDPDIFISQSNALARKLREAKQQKERLLDRGGDQILTQTQELIDILETGPKFLDSFNAELFESLVDKIIVESNEKIRFRLKNGLELSESIERTRR